MTISLFDPLTAPTDMWPENRSTEQAFIIGVARTGIAGMVANASAQWLALRAGDRVFPVTVNATENGQSYICHPHSAYVLYARREMEIVDLGWSRHALRPAIAALDLVLRSARINQAVQLDNWLLSTNLHGDWNGDTLPAIRRYLAQRFPDHFLLLRSLDPWSCPALLQAARDDGWILVPSRQIWVTDDLAREWLPRRDVRRDHRKLERSGLLVEDLHEMTPVDAHTIATLYHQLYVGKYSPLNPVFTPAFVAMTHDRGILRYRVAREPQGPILAVGSQFRRAGIMTPPVVGYDTSRPRSEGLYRIACLLFTQPAMAAGMRLHGSAGAAGFKRQRGAHGVIEYSAFFAGHLSPARRRTVTMLASLLEKLVVPIMRQRGL